MASINLSSLFNDFPDGIIAIKHLRFKLDDTKGVIFFDTVKQGNWLQAPFNVHVSETKYGKIINVVNVPMTGSFGWLGSVIKEHKLEYKKYICDASGMPTDEESVAAAAKATPNSALPNTGVFNADSFKALMDQRASQLKEQTRMAVNEDFKIFEKALREWMSKYTGGAFKSGAPVIKYEYTGNHFEEFAALLTERKFSFKVEDKKIILLAP